MKLVGGKGLPMASPPRKEFSAEGGALNEKLAPSLGIRLLGIKHILSKLQQNKLHAYQVMINSTQLGV